jgi:hypothetical protein
MKEGAMELPLKAIKISIIFDHSSLFPFSLYLSCAEYFVGKKAGFPEVSIITV